METRPVFDNLSPIDHRYYQANREQFEKLALYLSESSSVQYCIKVEVALLRAHLRRIGKTSDTILRAIDQLPDAVTPEAVYDEEVRTRHNIRALVRVIKRHLPESVSHLVHLGATSVDILDTAQSLRVRGVIQDVVIPLLIRLERQLIKVANEHADSLQIGRTHGQHGVPITFGFAIAEYVSRLGQTIPRILDHSNDLRGKISGAMGAFNSTSLIVSDPEVFEDEVLADIGLKPADHATQIVQPEFMLRLLLELNIAFGVIANLADDLRNLQRTEIDEVREVFAVEQVGSSTMPQKRNPWNSEHVKSLWKAFSPRVVSFFMDQISEHQRDLTNSASSRFVPDYISGFVAAVNRMVSVLDGLQINVVVMKDNAVSTRDMALAEAAYTLLASSGVSDAHEVIRRATLAAEETERGLVDVLRADPEVWVMIKEALALMSDQTADSFFSDPSYYRGKAAEIARAVCQKYESMLDQL